MLMRQPGQLRALLAASLNLCLLTTLAFAQRRQPVVVVHDRRIVDRGENVSLDQLPETNTQGSTLQVGTPVERQIGPGQVHVYNIAVEENMFVQLVVVQSGVDVTIQVGSPTGKSLGDFDSPNGANGPEPVSFVAITAGTYRVVVAPLNRQDQTTGKYEIKIVELRQATDQEIKTSKNVEVVKAKGLALLTEVDGLIAEQRLVQSRARAQLQAARLLWDVDEKRSSKYLADAVNSVKEIFAAIDPASYEYMQAHGQISTLRNEIAQLLASRDPEAALDFIHTTKPPGNPWGGDPRDLLITESSLELSISNQLLASDPKRMAQIARQNLKKGYSTNLIETLAKLRSKQPELAAELANEIGAKLVNENLLKKQDAAMLAANLFRNCRATQRDVQKAGLGESPIDSLISPEMCRDLLQKSIQDALSFKQPAANTYTPERDAAWNLLTALQSLGQELETVVTGSTASVEKKLTELNTPSDPNQVAFQQVQNKINEAPIDTALESVEKVPTELRDQLYTQIANNAASRGEGARARQLINEKFPNNFQRRQALSNIDMQEMYFFMSHGKIDDALRTIAAARTPRERANLLSQIVRQIGQGQKRATAITQLDQARSLLSPAVQAQDQEQLRALLELARMYARYDSKRAFDIVEPLIDQLNELCGAARTLEGFGPQYYHDDELDLEGSNTVAYAATQLTGAIGNLAIVNFERAKSAADRLRLPEVRLRAYLDIAQATTQGR
jgi:hypothetical protein